MDTTRPLRLSRTASSPGQQDLLRRSPSPCLHPSLYPVDSFPSAGYSYPDEAMFTPSQGFSSYMSQSTSPNQLHAQFQTPIVDDSATRGAQRRGHLFHPTPDGFSRVPGLPGALQPRLSPLHVPPHPVHPPGIRPHVVEHPPTDARRVRAPIASHPHPADGVGRAPLAQAHTMQISMDNPTENHSDGVPSTLTPDLVDGSLRGKFLARELYHLVRVAGKRDPWNAKYGQKGKIWGEILAELQRLNCFTGANVDTIKNKMNAMITYHDGDDVDKSCDVKEVLESPDGNLLASLLDYASELHDTAKKNSKEKSKKQVKDEEERRVGGAVLRDASTKTMPAKRKRASTESESDGEDENSGSEEKENKSPNTGRRGKKKVARRSEEVSIAEILLRNEQRAVAEAERNAKFQESVLQKLEDGNRVYERSQMAFLDILNEKL